MSTPLPQPLGDNGSLAPNQSKPNTHRRILVVDDEKLIRQLNSKVLILSHFEVDTAQDGAAAWNALQAVNYGLLITDNRMPKLSGIELVKKCRCEGMTLPIIIASAAPPANHESLQLAAILLKPFTGDQLLKTVKAVMRGQLPNNTTPNVKQCARSILAYEAAAARLAVIDRSAAARLCDKLRGPLSNLTGVDVYRSLLSRALVLTSAEVPWMRTLEINAGESVEGLDTLEVGLDSRTITEGETVLVSQLLGLLVALIGPALTLPLLKTIWPTMDDLTL